MSNKMALDALKKIAAMDAEGVRADDLGRAAVVARAAIAAPEAEPTIPEGWGFSSADFSLQASGVSDYGGVMLVRVGVHRSRWHLLSEAQKEETALYVSGTGKTIAEAIADAAKDCAPLPSTPPKD